MLKLGTRAPIVLVLLVVVLSLPSAALAQLVTHDSVNLDDGGGGAGQDPFIQWFSEDGINRSWIWARSFGRLDFAHNLKTFMKVENDVPTDLLNLSAAGVVVQGDLSVSSRRSAKTDIESLLAKDALEAFESLEPVRFRYIASPESELLGFIVDDAPGLVNSAGGQAVSPMKLITVLTKVVQSQQEAIEELRGELASLKERHGG